MIGRLAELIRGLERKDSYSRALQAARVRAAYQRAYFAPALFNLIPVKTDLIASVAVDTRWRLYYNDDWIHAHTVEENAAVLIHEVSHLLREHDARRHAAGVRNERLWNTAADCEINDDLLAEGLPLPDNPPTPERYGLNCGENAETYYRKMLKPLQSGDGHEAADERMMQYADCGSGAHGEPRPWEVPADDGSPGGVAAVDPVKAKLVQREVARQILDRAGEGGDAPLAWKRWAQTVLTPQVDVMATIRHVVRKALRDSTMGRSDRTYRRPHRRQPAYGGFLMPSFHQPRPRPGFLIDTSASMQDTQLSRAVAELGGLTRQLGYGAEVIVACCDVAVHPVKKYFSVAQLELIGGGGTNVGTGIEWFVRHAAIDVLVLVSDCQTPWPAAAPPFPVVTIRVGDGAPPPWGTDGHNRVITVDDA